MEDNSGGGNFSHYRSFLNAYNQMEQLVSTYISFTNNDDLYKHYVN